MQVGFLAHLAVCVLSSEALRVQVLALNLLQAIAEVEVCPETLARYFPGVCTALAKLLLKKDAQARSKAVVAGASSLGAWASAVLAEARVSETQLAALERRRNQAPRSLAEVFALSSANAAAITKGQDRGEEEWLEETSQRTSEVLVAVLQTAAGSLWSEKVSVRQAFLDLSIQVLQECGRCLTSGATEACFEVVFAALSDTAQGPQQEAKDFLQELMSRSGVERHRAFGHLDEWLVRLAQAFAPTPRRMDAASVAKRLARLDGLLQVLGESQLELSMSVKLTRSVFNACALTAENLRQLLLDRRSWASMPGTVLSQAEFVSLFPYEAGDCEEDSVSDWMKPINKGLTELPDVVQTNLWLLRSLVWAAGDEDLARRIKSMLGRFTRVFDAETLFTSVFDDEACSWSQVEDDQDLFPSDPQVLSPLEGSLHRRSAAMFALSAFLDATSGGVAPPWLVRHCLSIALSARAAHVRKACDAEEERVLHVLCSHQLLVSVLQAMAANGTRIHQQVKRVLKPLLEDLGARRSFVISLASRRSLMILHQLLVEEGSLAEPACASQQAVGRLLIEYADYLVGDICFQLRFEATMDDCDKLPLLLTAVVQHASLEMTPFLTDVVHMLLMTRRDSQPAWVLRVLACMVQRMAMVICESRQGTFHAQGGASGTPSTRKAQDRRSESSAVAGFLSGCVAWELPHARRDGFFLDDLGRLLDEDPDPEGKEDREARRAMPPSAGSRQA
ncbi:unnamed protein product [Effrenium voratum]|nr:unnamed protein product [Effrenium voratum]